ncbi:hypothetical protein ABZ419_29545 [Streptomyces cinnamoneus]
MIFYRRLAAGGKEDRAAIEGPLTFTYPGEWGRRVGGAGPRAAGTGR